MASVNTTKAILGQSAMDDRIGKNRDGKRDVTKMKDDRAKSRKQIAEMKEKAAKLQEELAEASDFGFWDHVGSFLFGSDNGVSEISDNMARNAADMERTQNNLQIMKSEMQGEMKQLKEAGEEVSDAYSAIEELEQNDRKLVQTLI